jgi:hypothetical protein
MPAGQGFVSWGIKRVADRVRSAAFVTGPGKKPAKETVANKPAATPLRKSV